MINHKIMAALLVILLAPAAAQAEESFAPDKKVESDITACLLDARTKAPDATDHNHRVLLASACICASHKELCNGGGIPQDTHMRQRINEDK